MLRSPAYNLRMALHRLPLAALIALTVAALGLACAMWGRLVREERASMHAGGGLPVMAHAETLPRSGRFTAKLDYTCYGAPGSGEVSSRVLWDDSWFFGDPDVYNHDLATASSVLSAIAYSESGHYQMGNDSPAYMESALEKLGFAQVSTESYRYRSEVIDEMLDVVTQDADGVAYTIARKPLASKTDKKRDLILVSVRGSYGAEWLSNFTLHAQGEDTSSSEDALSCEDAHHPGYRRAAQEILDEIATWSGASRAHGRDVSILLCGHSRGGAVAGLVGAELNHRQKEGGSVKGCSADRVFAYTFASPGTTIDADEAASHPNIFNILNPADVVCRVPLKQWGYMRYGEDVALPSVDDRGFDGAHRKMQRRFKELTGEASSYDPLAKRGIDALVKDISESVKSSADFMTPWGIASVASACAAHIDPTTILLGHYPSVYIAWMEALN